MSNKHLRLAFYKKFYFKTLLSSCWKALFRVGWSISHFPYFRTLVPVDRRCCSLALFPRVKGYSYIIYGLFPNIWQFTGMTFVLWTVGPWWPKTLFHHWDSIPVHQRLPIVIHPHSADKMIITIVPSLFIPIHTVNLSPIDFEINQRCWSCRGNPTPTTRAGQLRRRRLQRPNFSSCSTCSHKLSWPPCRQMLICGGNRIDEHPRTK